MKLNAKTIFKGYAYAWLTLGFFLGSLVLHWWFGWKAFVDEAATHHQAPEMNSYLAEMLRDTFENWQSEFLQLLQTLHCTHRLSRRNVGDGFANEAELFTASQSIVILFFGLLARSSSQPGHPDHEEFVEIGADDGKKFQSLAERRCPVFCDGEHSRLKSEEAHLGIEELPAIGSAASHETMFRVRCRRAIVRRAFPPEVKLCTVARTFGSSAKMVCLFHRAGELAERILTAAQMMNAQLEKARMREISSRDDSVVVNLQSRSAEPVASDGAGESLDLELDPYYEQRGVDQRAQPAASRRGLSNSMRNVVRANRRIDSVGAAVAFADRDRERAGVVRAQPQTTDDVPLAQGIVWSIEK